jgi:hypothetical protein
MHARIAVLIGCLGCGSSSMPSEGGDAYVQTLPDAPCSVDNVTGTLPGVSITISSERCVYRRGERATFSYRVAADANVPAIEVPETSSCSCAYRTPALETWVAYSIGGMSAAGERQIYCLCDTGCCAPRGATTVQPSVGMLDRKIEWSGRTWNGPSDTGNPEGDFFRPGRYSVSVNFTGYGQGNVLAELPIEIIP